MLDIFSVLAVGEHMPVRETTGAARAAAAPVRRLAPAGSKNRSAG